MRKLLIIIILLASFASVALAQSDALFSQYYELPSYYNPSAIGRSDFVRIRGGARLQWVGIDNAPTTMSIAADMPLKLFGKRFAVGLIMQNDKAGLYDNMSLAGQVGYKFKALKGHITVGVQGGIVNEGFRGSQVKLDFDDDYHQGTDDAIPTTDVSGTAFDLGVGVWYEHPRVWAGLSCQHLLEPTITFSGENGAPVGDTQPSGATGETKKYKFDVKRALYFMAGGNIPIKNTLFEVLPSAIVACDITGTTTFEVTARTRWKKFLSGGFGYRYKDAVTVTLAGEYKGFFLGYSYDYPLSAISKVSSGSHEIMAGYSLKLDLGDKNLHRHKSLRTM